MVVVFPGKASGQLVCRGRLKDVMCESQKLGIFSYHKQGKNVFEGDGNEINHTGFL